MTVGTNTVFFGLKDVGSTLSLQAVYSKVSAYLYKILGTSRISGQDRALSGGGGKGEGLVYALGGDIPIEVQDKDIQTLTGSVKNQHHTVSGAQTRSWSGDSGPALVDSFWPRVLFPSMGLVWDPDPQIGVHLIRAGTEYWKPMEDSYKTAIPFRLQNLANDSVDTDWGRKFSTVGDGFYTELNDWFTDTDYIAHISFTLSGSFSPGPMIRICFNDGIKTLGLRYDYNTLCGVSISPTDGSNVPITGLQVQKLGLTIGLSIVLDKTNSKWHILANGNSIYEIDYTSHPDLTDPTAYQANVEYGIPLLDKSRPFFGIRLLAEGELVVHQFFVAGKEMLASPSKSFGGRSPDSPTKVDSGLYPGQIPGLGSTPANRVNGESGIYSKWDGLKEEVGLGASTGLGEPTITFPRPE